LDQPTENLRKENLSISFTVIMQNLISLKIVSFSYFFVYI
jgi:hypothetical protein